MWTGLRFARQLIMERGTANQVETVSPVGEAVTISYVFLTLFFVTFQISISSLAPSQSLHSLRLIDAYVTALCPQRWHPL